MIRAVQPGRREREPDARPYQRSTVGVLINEGLRECVQGKREPLEATLRPSVRNFPGAAPAPGIQAGGCCDAKRCRRGETS